MSQEAYLLSRRDPEKWLRPSSRSNRVLFFFYFFSSFSVSQHVRLYTSWAWTLSLSLSLLWYAAAVCGYIATTRITPCPRSYKKAQHLPRRLDLSPLVSLSHPLIPTATKSQKQEKKDISSCILYKYTHTHTHTQAPFHDMPSSPESLISSDSLLISHLDKN
jgi:hypothetical protein